MLIKISLQKYPNKYDCNAGFNTKCAGFNIKTNFLLYFCSVMKKIQTLTDLRDKDLQNLYSQIIKSSAVNQRYLTRDVIIDTLTAQPAPRFYICARQAQSYVVGYYKNRGSVNRSNKKAMILNLVQVFEQIRPQNMHLPMSEIWQMVVNHPADSFYLSHQRILEIIYNYRRK